MAFVRTGTFNPARESEQGRLLVVVHAEGDDEVIRIISARPPTGREWRTYAESRRR
jgi:uncharacterized DUF497 family protein